jgi:hypothetical protein
MFLLNMVEQTATCGLKQGVDRVEIAGVPWVGNAPPARAIGGEVEQIVDFGRIVAQDPLQPRTGPLTLALTRQCCGEPASTAAAPSAR